MTTYKSLESEAFWRTNLTHPIKATRSATGQSLLPGSSILSTARGCSSTKRVEQSSAHQALRAFYSFFILGEQDDAARGNARSGHVQPRVTALHRPADPLLAWLLANSILIFLPSYQLLDLTTAA